MPETQTYYTGIQEAGSRLELGVFEVRTHSTNYSLDEFCEARLQMNGKKKSDGNSEVKAASRRMREWGQELDREEAYSTLLSLTSDS